MSFQPFLGFAPDMDYDTPGAFSDCQHMVPTPRGMRVQPGWATIANMGAITLTSGRVNGYGCAVYSFGATHFAGTTTRIYHAFSTSAAWTDVSRGGGYSNVSHWTFAPFGSHMIAAAASGIGGGCTIQQCMIGGAASDISGGPVARVVVSASRFVLAFGDQDYGDRWRCCARDDHTSWTASLSTLAATGRIVDEPGPITAAIELNGDVVVFKYRGVFLGQFTGAPEVWTWRQLPIATGCVSARAVCRVPDGIAFAGGDDVYLYDGASFRGLLAGKAKEWWQSTYDWVMKQALVLSYDEPSGQLWVSAINIQNHVLVIDLQTGRLGRARYGADMICASLGDVAGNASHICGFMVTATGAGPRHFAKLDPAISWFDNADFTFARDSAEQAPYFVMPELGDGMSEVEMTELRLKWREAPDDATAVHYTRPYAGGPLEVVGERPLSDTKSFQTRANARYHRVKVRLQDNAEVTGYAYEPTPTGRKGAR